MSRLVVFLLLPLAVFGAAPLGIESTARIGFADSSFPAVQMISDSSGSLYVLGYGSARTMPITNTLGTGDLSGTYLMKLSPGGTKIEYLTVLGFRPQGIAVDRTGSVHALIGSCVSKINPAGSAIISRFCLGDGVEVAALALDSEGHVYLAGSADPSVLKATEDAFQRQPLGRSGGLFLAKLNLDLTGLVFCTYLSGSYTERASAVAVDDEGSVYVMGRTWSVDFPITAEAYRSEPTSWGAPFLSRISPDGSRLLYSTFTGGNHDSADILRVDSSGRAVVLHHGDSGTTVLRFNTWGTAATALLLLRTFSGWPRSLTLDKEGNSYFLGFAGSTKLPVKNSLGTCHSVESDLYLAIVTPSGELVQSTYFPFSGGDNEVLNSAAMIVAPDSSVFVVGRTDPSQTPSRTIDGMTSNRYMLTRLVPGLPAQHVRLGCVGNLADHSRSLAPGQLLTLTGEELGPVEEVVADASGTGRLPFELAGINVTANGTRMPLLRASNTRIDAIAPWALTQGSKATICVHGNGETTNCIEQEVRAAGPAVFYNEDETVVAWNEDGTVNSQANPAARGSYVAVLVSGLGLLDPQPEDGVIVHSPLLKPILPVTAYARGFANGRAIWVRRESRFVRQADGQPAGVSVVEFEVTDNSDLFLSSGDGLSTWGSPTFRVFVAMQ